MLFSIEPLTHVGQSVTGELLTFVRKKSFRCTLFKYKFLKDGVSYSCDLLIGYGLCNGLPSAMVNHHQYILDIAMGGR